MGYSSQAGHVALRTQSVAGTFAADFASNAIAVKVKGGGLAPNRELLIPDPEIGGGRDVTDAYLGAVSFSGDYEFYARLNAMLTMWYAALGFKAIKTPGGTAEVTTLTKSGTISGGTFTITYSAQTTTDIAWDATAAEVQAALIALSNIADGDVEVTGGPIASAPFTLTWGGTLLGNVTAPTVTTTNLTGSTPDITVATATAGTDYTVASVHTFLPSDGAQLPFVSIEEKIGNGLEAFHYTDAVVNTLHLEVDANGYVMGTLGVIAREQLAGISPIDPTVKFDNLPMMVGTNVVITYGGLSLPAKTFSFDLNNNFEDDDYRLGNFFIGDLTPKRREVEMTIGIREEDSDLWRQAVYGTSSATSPGGLVDKDEMIITISTYEQIPSATPTLSYSMTIRLPKVALVPYALEPSGDDVIESDLNFKAIRPDQSKKLLYVTVTTPRTAVA